jgi:hypothetical protein
MDDEWKLDDVFTPGDPQIYLKQARPFHGWTVTSAPEGTCGD